MVNWLYESSLPAAVWLISIGITLIAGLELYCGIAVEVVIRVANRRNRKFYFGETQKQGDHGAGFALAEDFEGPRHG